MFQKQLVMGQSIWLLQKKKFKEKKSERTRELININNANVWEINILLVSSITKNTIY